MRFCIPAPMNPPVESPRLVAVSNRLPVVISRTNGKWKVRPGSGGLVSAMMPVLRDRGGLWIGWSGTSRTGWEEALPELTADIGYELHPVNLTPDEVSGFYAGFANQIIWPLFHDLQTRCNFNLKFWQAYQQVNRKFADIVLREARPNDFIWVHDYQLMNVAFEMRRQNFNRRIGFFLHIPFPVADIFIKLPWRRQILEAMLCYDLIGFQTLRDRQHFIACLRELLGGVRVSGRGAVLEIEVSDRRLRVGTFPIGIDYATFAKRAAMPQVSVRAQRLREAIPGEKLLLGVDRLDYTKGLPERLAGFDRALEVYPELQGQITLVQLVVPSRTEVTQYQTLKAQIEQLVSGINGRWTRNGWVPIHYLYRSVDQDTLLAHYRAADIMLVTPLKDGMNLVAKEFCACRIRNDGVLILSEFAGASAQLGRGALLVNPYNYETVADTILKAYRMEADEQIARMRRMRANIRRQNIFWWVNGFLLTSLSKKLVDFPLHLDYVTSSISDTLTE